MTSDEIENYVTAGDRLVDEKFWEKEIAYQLALLNEKLATGLTSVSQITGRPEFITKAR